MHNENNNAHRLFIPTTLVVRAAISRVVDKVTDSIHPPLANDDVKNQLHFAGEAFKANIMYVLCVHIKIKSSRRCWLQQYLVFTANSEI